MLLLGEQGIVSAFWHYLFVMKFVYSFNIFKITILYYIIINFRFDAVIYNFA
jgi:hypothetical protein